MKKEIKEAHIEVPALIKAGTLVGGMIAGGALASKVVDPIQKKINKKRDPKIANQVVKEFDPSTVKATTKSPVEKLGDKLRAAQIKHAEKKAAASKPALEGLGSFAMKHIKDAGHFIKHNPKALAKTIAKDAAVMGIGFQGATAISDIATKKAQYKAALHGAYRDAEKEQGTPAAKKELDVLKKKGLPAKINIPTETSEAVENSDAKKTAKDIKDYYKDQWKMAGKANAKKAVYLGSTAGAVLLANKLRKHL